MKFKKYMQYIKKREKESSYQRSHLKFHSKRRKMNEFRSDRKLTSYSRKNLISFFYNQKIEIQ